MSVKDVTRLRKEGRFQEAFSLAKEELNADPNEWTRMSMFWVLRDIALKIHIPDGNMERARVCLNGMGKLLPNMMDDSGIGEKAYQNLYKRVLPNAELIQEVSDMSKTSPIDAYNKIQSQLGTDGSNLDASLHEDLGWIIYRYLKVEVDSLPSVQVRSLLRDYIRLENERPSILHSMILNFALNYAKTHPEFSFYNFFKLWGTENLRSEDYKRQFLNGGEIPSLVSRICRVIMDLNDSFMVSDFVALFGKHAEIVVESLRETYFWKLMSLYKEKSYQELWYAFEKYAEDFPCLGPSHWHSEILNIANRFMSRENDSMLIRFAMQWDGDGNFRDEDWEKVISEDGKEFPCLAVKTAKNCFEYLKKVAKNSMSEKVLAWLQCLYGEIKKHDSDDDWSIRNYATICMWRGETETAISAYKSLLLHMGEKFYLWSELANCVSEISEDKALQIGLLLKAKSLEKNEDYIGDIHLKLASLWLTIGHPDVANKELDAYVRHRREKGWRINNLYNDLITAVNSYEGKQEWIDFSEYTQKAEDYVFSDYEKIDFVLTGKWTVDNVERCNFYADKELQFTVKTKRFPILRKTKEGEIISFRCNVVQETVQDYKYASRQHKTITVKKVTPLVAYKSDKDSWSILTTKYGVIDFVNETKCMHHILTQDSEPTFCKYVGKPLSVNTFVKFREYEDKRKDETRICVVGVELCPSDEALPHMRSRIVVVDDVNNSKQLFHVVLGPKLISDIVRFDQTNIRPSIGDFLRITYLIKKNKEGKKRIKFLDIQKTDEECPNVKGTVTGRLELKYREDWFDEEGSRHPDFAFIKDLYVHRNLLRKYNITADCNICAKVVLGGDNKWKVYDLELLSSES